MHRAWFECKVSEKLLLKMPDCCEVVWLALGNQGWKRCQPFWTSDIQSQPCVYSYGSWFSTFDYNSFHLCGSGDGCFQIWELFGMASTCFREPVDHRVAFVGNWAVWSFWFCVSVIHFIQIFLRFLMVSSTHYCCHCCLKKISQNFRTGRGFCSFSFNANCEFALNRM